MPAGVARCAGRTSGPHGVTPERVEAEIVRLSGGGLFGDLDRGALAAVGVDADAVRTATEATFGREALTRAARAAHRKPPWFDLRPSSGAWPKDGVFLPHGPGAGQALTSATRRARARDATQSAGVEDLAPVILAVSERIVSPIVSALGASGPALSTAILECCHPAR
jgi:hypothetical protein